ncbi:MAG: EF-Tu/IF-2/RF-3 family GTPase [Promethearchaeota archaeon]
MSDSKERNFLVGIFGENFHHRNIIGQTLGSPGTKSDIQFYNRLDESLGHVFCALTPNEYPEKVKPFLQVLTITTTHVLVIDLEIGLNAVVGEILVGMDMFNQLFTKNGLIVIANINSKTEWKLNEVKKKILSIITTTSLKNVEIIELKDNDKSDLDNLKTKIIELNTSELNSDSKSPYTKILIDHAFPVKGIGTVILGVVKNGLLNAGGMVEIVGYDSSPPKKVILRSIQKHDRDFKTAHEGDRVGLALKGNISHHDISRDNIIVSQGTFKHEREIIAKVYVNQFYKPKSGIIKPGDGTQYYALSELKLSPIKFISGEDLIPGKSGNVKISIEKPLVHDGKGLKGIITELNRFENKLRIVGHYNQLIK